MVANMVVMKAGVMGVAMGECFLHFLLESFWSPTMIAMQDSLPHTASNNAIACKLTDSQLSHGSQWLSRDA